MGGLASARVFLAAASNDYYSTSAQVLPVLLLVLLFEARAENSANPKFQLLLIVWGILWIVGGEVAALHALAVKPNDRTDDMLFFAYFMGGLAILVEQITVRMRQAAAFTDKTWPSALGFCAFLGCLWLLILFGLGTL